MKLIIIIILIILVIFLYNKNYEGFDYKTNCSSCENKSYHQCLNCENCGVCVTEFGDMYCVKGDIKGPTDRKDCKKWFFGNIYPQYYYKYYDDSLLQFKDDSRFYPYLKYLDDKNGTKYFSKEHKNNFYKMFNNSLKYELYRK